MVNFEYIDNVNNIALLSFSSMQMPTFQVNPVGGWVDYGKKNDFPNQLLRLYEEHEEHNAIVTAKANYLFGQSIKAVNEEQQAIVDSFFSYANRYEKWDTINEKVKIDCEAFNCFYLQVITDLTGKPKEYYHLQYSNIRTNKEKNKVWYSENWLDNKEPRNSYDIFDFNSKKPGVYFLRFEFYKPTQNKLAAVYATPQYIACVKSISTDIDISTFNNHYVANGFSAGTMITLMMDDPGEPAKRKLKEQILNTHSAPEKAGSVVLAYAGKDGQAPVIDALSVDDLDKKFEFTSKRCLDKIIRGHNVTNPELFGVKTEGQLGTRVSLKESHELMLNTYTKPRQKPVLAFYSDLIFMSTGQVVPLEIEQSEAIGLDLANDVDLTQDERRELKGYKPLTAPKLDATGQPLPIEAEANEHIKSMTRKQMGNMHGITNDYKKGKATLEQAIMSLKGYGLTEDDAKTWLGVKEPIKMSSHVDDFIIAQFEAIDTTETLELELLSEEDAHIHNSKQALKFEFDMQLKFADNDKPGFLSNLVSGLLGKVGIGKSEKKDEPEYKTEIITKYQYALRPGAPDLLPGSKSRTFCQKLLALKDKSGNPKQFTFEQIDSVRLAGLSNGMPEVDNIWDFSGGFATNPETGETTPWCRHYWKPFTYKVKTKI